MANNLVPSQDQIMGQLRVIIPSLGTIVSALGVSGVTANKWVDVALALVGPISYVVAGIWQLVADSRASIMASAAKPVDANTPAPQIVLPVQEAVLAQSLPANVNTTETKKVVNS